MTPPPTTIDDDDEETRWGGGLSERSPCTPTRGGAPMTEGGIPQTLSQPVCPHQGGWRICAWRGSIIRAFLMLVGGAPRHAVRVRAPGEAV